MPFAAVRPPVQYRAHHGDFDYYVTYRRRVLGVMSSANYVNHQFPELDLRNPDDWDAHHTDVFLSIVSRTLRLEHELTLIEWPCRGAIEDLERFARKRRPHYHLGLGLMAPGRPARPDPQFGVIDYERWGLLWSRWDRARRGR